MDNNVIELAKTPVLVIEPKQYDPGFVDLDFLRKVGQSIVAGWEINRGSLEGYVEPPRPLKDRISSMLSRHIKGVIGVQFEGWLVVLRTGKGVARYEYRFLLELEDSP